MFVFPGLLKNKQRMSKGNKLLHSYLRQNNGLAIYFDTLYFNI